MGVRGAGGARPRHGGARCRRCTLTDALMFEAIQRFVVCRPALVICSSRLLEEMAFESKATTVAKSDSVSVSMTRLPPTVQRQSRPHDPPHKKRGCTC